MKKMLLIAAIAVLLVAAASAEECESRFRRAVRYGDPLPGRTYYLAALVFISTAVLFGIGFVAAKFLLPEKVTGKHLLALTWFLVAIGLGWAYVNLLDGQRFLWTRETMELSWPVVLSGLTAGAALARLSYGRWIALLPPLLGLGGILWAIKEIIPLYIW